MLSFHQNAAANSACVVSLESLAYKILRIIAGMELLDEFALERAAVVANNRMNRERRVSGVNSYTRELGFDPVDGLRAAIRRREPFAWLDMCCGRGRALLSTFELLTPSERPSTILQGVDLVDAFDPIPAEATGSVTLEAASVHRWQATRTYDLITCVHGLHYVGDKLRFIFLMASWLKGAGRLVANLDLGNLRSTEDGHFARRVRRCLLAEGFSYDARRRLLSAVGPLRHNTPFIFVGADPNAGPNYSGQEAVDSYYRAISP